MILVPVFGNMRTTSRRLLRKWCGRCNGLSGDFSIVSVSHTVRCETVWSEVMHARFTPDMRADASSIAFSRNFIRKLSASLLVQSVANNPALTFP